jgi:uncharacterized protein (DUF1786 family)
VVLCNETVHDQTGAGFVTDQRVHRLEQVSFVGAVGKRLADFEVTQDRMRRGERFAFHFNLDFLGHDHFFRDNYFYWRGGGRGGTTST